MKSLFPIYVFLIVLGFSSCGDFAKLQKYQKKWALRHPFAAIKVRKINSRTDVVYRYVKSKNLLDSFENGGKLDAYRHIYYMAMLSQKIKPKKLMALGEAHEKDNYLSFLAGKSENGEQPDSISTVMDIMNNSIGIELVGKSDAKLSPEAVSYKCMEAIQTGKAYFISRDEKGNYINCHGTIINMASYKGKWNVPKCLVQR